MDIQTDHWLEEIKARPPETEAAVQTELDDEALTQPHPQPREAFAPVETLDKATQILPDDPELFAFDEEVTLVLEALVAKTMEQSLLEVIDEEEMAMEGLSIK